MNKLYYRFGDIPEDETSRIWKIDEYVGKEKGLSVYEAHKNNDGKWMPVLPSSYNGQTLDSFYYYLRYFRGDKYIVTGDLLEDTGSDNEPLLKNVKIVEKL